jgi:CRISPR-associated protein Csb1
MSTTSQFDCYLSDDGPAALVIREHLMPVEGSDGVLFPATFAAGNGFPGGYNIDVDAGGRSVCLVDSIGSQANRIEPLFMRDKYRHLVPQIVVTAGDKAVNILEVGHRAGDALLRCSSLQDELQAAFLADCASLVSSSRANSNTQHFLDFRSPTPRRSTIVRARILTQQ